MKRIASFCVDHNKLVEGMYTSRVDGDITTYDIRMVIPNGGVYLENAAMHTFEHLFATYARNSKFESNIIYVGPMGCRTGFYFLVRDLSPTDAIFLVKESVDFISKYNDAIPGTTAIECGNYLEHDLDGAKKIASKMVAVLKDWSVDKLEYTSN